MAINFNYLKLIKDPDIDQIKSSVDEFLSSLSGPTIIDITGEDAGRCRVISTLIHGNEPSGLIAIHRWILTHTIERNIKPKTNLRIVIASVEAAQQSPKLSTRYLSDGLDLNRCFIREKNEGYYHRANLISQAIQEVSPEAVVDLHNTSGLSPSFAVATTEKNNVLSLASLFCQTVILSRIKLGALMEQDFQCPIVTIECGGREDQQAHEIAYQGIHQLSHHDSVQGCHHLNLVEVVEQPLRLQLKPDISLAYANALPENIQGVVLKSYIEQFNFGITCQGRALGWVDSCGLDNFLLLDIQGNNVIDEYFFLEQNQLISRCNLKLYMATSNLTIAKSDCLFYVVKSNSHHTPIT